MTEQEQNIADFQKFLKQADESIDFATIARKEGRLNDAWEDIQEADKYFREALRAQEYVTKEYLNQFQKLR